MQLQTLLGFAQQHAVTASNQQSFITAILFHTTLPQRYSAAIRSRLNQNGKYTPRVAIYALQLTVRNNLYLSKNTYIFKVIA